MIKSFISMFLMISATIAYARPVVVVLGDSLAAGYGVDKEESFPSLLEKKFKSDKVDMKVINAGLSGSTSASGPSRMNWQLKAKPTHLLLALGANDALRGINPADTTESLRKTIKIALDNHITVFILGMKAPPNYGKEFTLKFESIYINLSKEFKLDRFPFLLEGVAGDAALNQGDGIHPNAKGHQIIADHLYTFLKGKIH
ncbi:MAG: arylesterase [Pseudomonadota bacterium]